MRDDTMAGQALARWLPRLVGGALTAVLIVAVPVLAGGFVVDRPTRTAEVAIDPSDDALANGMQILEPAAWPNAGLTPAVPPAQPVEKVLRNWRFTDGEQGGRGRPKPSPK
jgi:hypothetical protein